MIKSWIARMICLVLILICPLTSFAQEQTNSWMDTAVSDGKQIVTTLTVEPGKMLSQIQPVVDLCKSLSVEFLLPEENTLGLAVLLDNQEALFGGLRANEAEGLYFQSNAIDSNALLFSVEDIKKLMAQSAEAMPEGMGEMSAFYANYFSALAEMKQRLDAGETLTDADVENYLKEMTGDDEAFLELIKSYIAKVQIVEGEFTGADHDPGTQQLTLTLTKEDFIPMMDTKWMHGILKQEFSAQPDAADLTEEQLDAFVTDTIEQVKAEFEQFDLHMSLTGILDAESWVLLTLSMTGKEIASSTENAKNEPTDVINEDLPEQQSQPASILMKIDYSRLTSEDVKEHKALMSMQLNDQEMMNASLLLTQQDSNWSYHIDFMGDNADEAILSKGTHETKDGYTQGQISFGTPAQDIVRIDYSLTRSDVANDGELSLFLIEQDASSPFVTFKMHQEATNVDSRFATIAAATPENSVKPLQMTATELQEYANAVMTNVQQTAMQVLSLLPASIFELILPGASETSN